MARILLTVPHAVCRSEEDKSNHFCDVVAEGAARKLFDYLTNKGHKVMLRVGDISRIENDLNRPESRDTDFRKRILTDFKRADFLLDVHCLAEGSLVYTEAGPKPIEQVKTGDRVWCCPAPNEIRFGTGQYRSGTLDLAPVTATLQHGIQEVFEIKAMGRTLRATATTPVAVVSGYKVVWKPVGLLQPGDRLVAANRLPYVENSEHFPSSEYWYEPTEELSRVVGFYLGDGTKEERNGRVHRVSLCEPLSGHYREDYRKLGEQVFNVTAGARPSMLRFCGQDTCEAFIGLGLDGNVYTKRLPSWVFKLSAEHRQSVFRGYAEADGRNKPTVSEWKPTLGRSVLTEKQTRLASVNRLLLEDFRMLALSCGFPVGNVYEQRAHGIIEGRLINSRTCYLTNVTMRDDAVSDLGVRTIQSIVSLGHKPVYDLEVEGPANFVADGVLVHNSYPQEHVSWNSDLVLLKWNQNGQDNRELVADLLGALAKADLDVATAHAEKPDDIVAHALENKLPAVLVEFSEKAFEKRKKEILEKFATTLSDFLNAKKEPEEKPTQAESLSALLGNLLRG